MACVSGTIIIGGLMAVGERNSSVELLRILAMIMIVASHSVLFSTFDLSSQPFSAQWLFFKIVGSQGKIGVAVFFAISAWFLSMDAEPTVRRSLRRAWVLEREVLIYSVGILGVFLLADHGAVGARMALRSLAPTTTGMWWYVTAYVVFLLFAPFLTVGLRRMGTGMHGALCLVLLAMWGLAYGMLPGLLMGFPGEQPTGFVGFVYMYVLVCFYRWHMRAWDARRGWALVGAGVGLIAVPAAAEIGVGALVGDVHLFGHPLFLAEGFKLPTLLIAFGLLVVAVRHPFSSRAVNRVASAMFAVYLITEFPLVRSWLWPLFDLGRVYGRWWAPLWSLGVVLLVMGCCVVVDLLRQLVFARTLDSRGRRGRWFDALWNRVAASRWLAVCGKRLRGQLKE